MNPQPSADEPSDRNRLDATLGTGRPVRRRLLFHHVPLALTSAVLLVLFMGLQTFDVGARSHADLTSGAFPLPRTESDGMEMDHDDDQAEGRSLTLDRRSRIFVTQLTVATGYVATVLLALTLLIGPVNLLLRRRNPVSSYLRRDVGTWTAIASVVHVVLGIQQEKQRGGVFGFLDLFVVEGRPLTNSFGWGNWTGLAATVLVVGLLVLSTDRSIRELKARRWKNLQRLNYALFALVAAHAFFYGALVRMTSPFTLLLVSTVIAVLLGQAVGIRLRRRKHLRPPVHEPHPTSSGPAR